MNIFIKNPIFKTSLLLLLLGLTFGLNAQISVTIEVNSPTCSGYTNGTATANATGGTAPYSYEWSDGQTGSTAYGLTDGIISINVFDANGNTTAAFATVTAPDVLNAAIDFNGDVCTASTGNLQGVATGGISPYTYEWSNGATGEFVSGLAEGGYYLTVTDNNGCQAITFYEVNDPLSIIVNTHDVICNGFCDASAEAVVSGGTAPYSYLWNTGMTGSVAFPLPAGTFCVTVTDGNGCTATNCNTINEPDALEAAITLNGDCDNDSDISASVSVTGGTPDYEINWSTGETGTSISGLTPNTTYSLTVTDANGCHDTESITVGELSQLAITISGENETCIGDADGSATVNPGGGVAPYQIDWSNGSENTTINDLSAGIYQVTVVDANGCTGIQSITVAEGTTIDVSTESIASACGDDGTGSISLTPTGGMAPYFFIYENGIGEPTSGQVENLAAGNYNVTVGDAQGCTTVVAINVSQIEGFVVSATATAESCNEAADGTGSIVSVSGNAVEPLTYEWDNGSTEETTTGLSAGMHTVTVTDANECMTISTVEVAAGEVINATFEINTDDCTGTLISVNVTGNLGTDITDFSYTTSTGETFTTPDFTLNVEAGEEVTITLNAINVAGCTSMAENSFTSEVLEVEVPEVLQACLSEDLSATANANQDVTYEWTSDADIFVGATNIANPVINTNIAGEFPAQVTMTNALGCSVVEEVLITVTDAEIMPDPALISSAQNCDNNVLDFTNANDSADSYDWVFDFPNGETVSGGSEISYEFAEPGIYDVALIPTVACADTVIIQVEVAEPQVAEFTFETNCENGFTVVFTDMSSNPDQITAWNWEINGETYNEQNPSVAFEQAGTIDAILTVTYGNDCELETMQPVEIAPFNPELPQSQLVDCGGGTDTELFPNANSDYTYFWSPATGLSDPNIANPTATVNETTTYDLTITDPSGECTETTSVTINVPTALQGPSLEDISLCEQANQSADATIEGGVNYTWSDDENFENVVGEEAIFGFPVTTTPVTYYVMIEDEFGCTVTENFTVGAYPIDFDFGPISEICEGTEVGNLNIPNGLTVDWGGDNPIGMLIFEDDFFLGTVTNDAGCFVSDTLFVTPIIATRDLIIEAAPDTVLLGESSELFVTPDDRYTYEWDNAGDLNDSGISNPSATPEETTTYTVTVTDERECTGTLDVTIVVENNCEPFLYFPNAFTPDADGLNDILYVEGLSLDEVFFAIYNRWGEKVYESNDISEGWDGTHNGEQVSPDVYGYYLRVRCTDGNEIFRKGNVSVLR